MFWSHGTDFSFFCSNIYYVSLSIIKILHFFLFSQWNPSVCTFQFERNEKFGISESINLVLFVRRYLSAWSQELLFNGVGSTFTVQFIFRVQCFQFTISHFFFPNGKYILFLGYTSIHVFSTILQHAGYVHSCLKFSFLGFRRLHTNTKEIPIHFSWCSLSKFKCRFLD